METMLRTMDTVHFCEQINVSVRQTHYHMTWRDRDHIKNTLTWYTGVLRNSGQCRTNGQPPENRCKPAQLQRQPQRFITSPTSHRLRILSSDQCHRKKLNISKKL